MISRREGFFGLLVSEGFVDCIGLPQFQQNAYLSSMAEPQCSQTPPPGSVLGGTMTVGGASVSMSPGGIAASAVFAAGIADSPGLAGGIVGCAALASVACSAGRTGGVTGSAALAGGITGSAGIARSAAFAGAIR